MIINNPLASQIFIPTILRLTLIFLSGFAIVALFSIQNLKGLFKSDAWIRYKGWFFMAPVFIIVMFFGGIASILFTFLLCVLALTEFRRMSKIRDRYYFLSIFFALVTIFVTTFRANLFFILPLTYFLIINPVSILENNPKNALSNVAYTLFANIWINFSLAHLILIGRLSNGQALLLMIGFSVALSDIGAYCFGKLFAKMHILQEWKIADKISPNKTYIGIIGHIIGALTGIAVMKFALPISWNVLLPLGILIGLSDVIGGFTLSMVKRTFRVKNAGKLIPGHGGVLDRIDSLLRVAVISYYLLLILT